MIRLIRNIKLPPEMGNWAQHKQFIHISLYTNEIKEIRAKLISLFALASYLAYGFLMQSN